MSTKMEAAVFIVPGRIALEEKPIPDVGANDAMVPDAMANLALVPDELTDEQVLMRPDIMSTGFVGAEAANIKLGDKRDAVP